MMRSIAGMAERKTDAFRAARDVTLFRSRNVLLFVASRGKDTYTRARETCSSRGPSSRYRPARQQSVSQTNPHLSLSLVHPTTPTTTITIPPPHQPKLNASYLDRPRRSVPTPTSRRPTALRTTAKNPPPTSPIRTLPPVAVAMRDLAFSLFFSSCVFPRVRCLAGDDAASSAKLQQ